jgi:hypothetical protein
VVPLTWRLPTAQKMPPGSMVIALSALSPGPVTGLGATAQVDQFQCSSRAAQVDPGSPLLPVIQPLLGESVAAPYKVWPGGELTWAQVLPFQCPMKGWGVRGHPIRR